jgi:hypothetical protein
MVNAVMPKNYHNPFPGRPVALDKSSLFLLSPEVDIKLLGSSMRGVFKKNGWESLFKRIERLQDTGKEPSAALLRDLRSFLKVTPWLDIFDAELAGDVESQKQLSEVSQWAWFDIGLRNNSVEPTPYWVQYTIEVEQASQIPEQMLNEERLSEALDAVRKDELLHHFLWPEAAKIWASKSPSSRLVPLLAAIVLEVRLSQLAAMDVGYIVKHLAESKENSFFLQVLPTMSGKGCTPMRRLLDWLKGEVGAKSLGKILETPALASIDGLDISTLKRWSSGRRYPSRNLIAEISKALFGNPYDSVLCILYTGVVYLNLMGYLSESLIHKSLKHRGTPLETLLAPWPLLPFNHSSFESWCQERYPVWLRFHKERLNHLQRIETAEAVS